MIEIEIFFVGWRRLFFPAFVFHSVPKEVMKAIFTASKYD